MNHRPIAVLIGLALAISATACDADKPARDRAVKKPPPAANFTLEAVAGADYRERPESGQKAQLEAQSIKQLVDAFYNVGFVNPAKWAGGQHPELASFFAAEAQASVAPNLAGLSLSDAAAAISKMKITDQRITKVSTLLEDDLTASHAVATVVFGAIATPKAKGQQPIDVAHSMTIWLRPEDGGWKIYAYSTNLKADSRVKAAAFGAPAQGTA